MDAILLALVVYLGIGVIALAILDWSTGRVRAKLRPAAADVQDKLVTTGNYVGGRSSMVLIVIALWIFWPVAIYGALNPSKNKRSDEQKRAGGGR